MSTPPTSQTSGNELPDPERPSSSNPTEMVLEYESQEPTHDPYAALRLPQYRYFAFGWLLAITGHLMLATAIAWEIYDRTHSKVALGFVAGVQVIPLFLLGLPAGQWADRFDRRRIMQISSAGSAICSLGLAMLSYRAGSVPWMFLLLGIGTAFLVVGRPARQALLPLIVPTKDFTNAVTWNSSIFQIAAMTGPALGGLILSYSVRSAYIIDAICGLGYAVVLAFITPRAVEKKPFTDNERGWRGVWVGLRFVARTKMVAGAMLLDLLAVLLGGAAYLLPVFSREILHVGSFGFGCLRAAEALGAFMTTLWIAHSKPMQHAGRAMLLAVLGFGVCTIVFGLSRFYWLSFAMLFGIGAFDSISVIVRHSLVQLLTPDAMRGRVASVNNISIGASNELGGLESGLAAAALGPVVAVVAGGVGTVLVVMGIGYFFPQLRKLGRLQDVKPEEVETVETAPGFPVTVGASAK